MLDAILKRLPRWLRPDSAPPPISPAHAGINYLGEHLDDRAAALKVLLVQRLRLMPMVRKAFLVRATVAGEAATRLLLVFAATSEPVASQSQGLLDLVQETLPPGTPLSARTIKPADCAPIERVCRPFYYSV